MSLSPSQDGAALCRLLDSTVVSAMRNMDWDSTDRDRVGEGYAIKDLGAGLRLRVFIEIYPSVDHGYKGRGRSADAITQELRAGDASIFAEVLSQRGVVVFSCRSGEYWFRRPYRGSDPALQRLDACVAKVLSKFRAVEK